MPSLRVVHSPSEPSGQTSRNHALKAAYAAAVNRSATRRPTARPIITLFTELETAPLLELLNRADVQALFATGDFGLAVAMLDLDTQRADAIRNAEALGVEVAAWLLLDRADGYWLNADNCEQAADRFAQLVRFADDHDLHLPRIGLDIEPPRADLDALMRDGLPELVRLIRQRRNRAAIAGAEAAYTRLCASIRATGRSVESYCLPMLADETRAGTALLRRILGIVDPAVDVRVPMAYSTYLGRALTASYLRDGPAGAIGVTGGGVYADQDAPRVLDWDQVRTQLDWATACGTRRLCLFSLEGCVEQAMLDQLIAWRPGPRPPLRWQAALGDAARAGLRGALHAERLLDRVRPVKASVRGRAPVATR